MSQRNSGYDRKEHDFYETPEWVTEALISCLPILPLRLWEPACGHDKIINVFKKLGFETVGTDIIFGQDFLQYSENFISMPCDMIITNPPFGKMAQKFIEHALKLLPDNGVAAFLLRTDFDHAKTRKHLFGDCPHFYSKVVLTKRITWFEPKPGEKGKSPSFNHAWFIWDKNYSGKPILQYV